MSPLLIETAGRRLVDGLWTELVRLGELWLHLISWLIVENGRVLASPSARLAPWFVLLLIVAGRALSPASTRDHVRTQRPTGGWPGQNSSQPTKNSSNSPLNSMNSL